MLAGLRLAGKREIGQMTAFDLVVLLLIANAVQNAMVGPDTSLTGGILAVGVLLVMNTIVSRLRLRLPWFRNLVEGTPTVLVRSGEIIQKSMRREGVDEQTLMAALREHGVAKLENVELAVLEVDGSISIESTGEPIRKGRRNVRGQHHN